jgi:carboxylesterase type B
MVLRYTRLGTVQGSLSQQDNSANVTSFLGLPYAKPPIGERRLKAPDTANVVWFPRTADEDAGAATSEPEPEPEGTAEPETTWQPEHVYDGTAYKSACMQNADNEWVRKSGQDVSISEDCLYLNIFTPYTEVS